MSSMVSRSIWIAALGGCGYAAWTVRQRSRELVAPEPPSWPAIAGTYVSSVDGIDDGAAADDTIEADRTAELVSVAAASTTHRTTSQTSAAAPRLDAPGSKPVSSPAAAWLPPIDGACPDGYPVKVSGSSGIYHVPGGRFYERTRPERCYASADRAAADGYRAAKA